MASRSRAMLRPTLSEKTIGREPRFLSATQVELSIGSPGEFYTLWTENISKGGMFLRTDDPPPVGTGLTVRIKMAEGTLTFSARVAHIVDRAAAAHHGHPPGVGVRFEEIPDRARAALERYVELIAKKAQTAARATPASDGGKWVLGIDLGTSNTAAVAVGPGEHKPISVIRSERNRGPILPSVVSYKNPDHPVVGWSARDMMLTDPLTTVYGWKRFLGRSPRNEFVSRNRVRFPFRIENAPERKELGAVVGSRIISFVDVASHILAEVRARARAMTERDITKAVVSVPAHFSTAQRRAVLEAGSRAGLEIIKLVNEPTVAALSFGVDRGMTGRVLIYDFGGGSFDATVVEINDNVFDARCTSGDSFLGGLDLDRAVMERLAQIAEQEHGIDVREEPVVAQRLLNAAENAKIALSHQEETRIHVPMIGFGKQGQEVDLEYTLGRDELERLTAPLIEKTIGIVEAMYESQGLQNDDVEFAILVGGQSHMPLVEQRIRRGLQQAPHVHPLGDAAVATGAAFVAKSVDDLAAPVLLDTLSVPIGMMLPGGKTQWVFERGVSLPAKRRIPLDLSNLPNVAIAFWEAPDLTSPERSMLGVARLPETLPEGEVALVVGLDESLRLSGTIEVNGAAIPLMLTNS